MEWRIGYLSARSCSFWYGIGGILFGCCLFEEKWDALMRKLAVSCEEGELGGRRY